MGRIRTIKPEILTDAKASRLSDMAWRLFVSSWLLADDAGRFPAEPIILAGQIFPGRDLVSVHGALTEVSNAGFLTLYRVNGELFAEIKAWTKHQKINRPSGPKFPGPSDGLIEHSVSPHGGLYADHDRYHDHEHDRDHDRESQQESRRAKEPPHRPALADEALQLAQILAQAVAKRQPESRPARETDACARRWALDIDRLHRLNGRPWTRIREVLEWSQRDAFWQANILSGKKLRDKFDQLEAQMLRPKPANGSRGYSAEDLWRMSQEPEGPPEVDFRWLDAKSEE